MYACHFIFLPIFSLSENVQRLGEHETLSRFDAMPCHTYLSSVLLSFFLFLIFLFSFFIVCGAVTRLHVFPTLIVLSYSCLSFKNSVSAKKWFLVKNLELVFP